MKYEPHLIDAIPSELRDRDQWVLWKKDERNGKATKVPYSHLGRKAKSDDSSTWQNITKCLESPFYLLNRFDGVGFVFSSDDQYIGIDLDGCRNPNTGTLDPWSAEIVERFSTYCEISPSGTGVKFFAKTNAVWKHKHKVTVENVGDGYGEKKPGIEIYQERRYFAVTGQRFNGHTTVCNCDDALEWIATKYKFRRDEPSSNGDAKHDTKSDTEKLKRASGYLAKCPPAISGSGGSEVMFKACLAVVKGFDASKEDATRLITNEYNPRCQPPWNDREIEHKIQDAMGSGIAAGYLLNAKQKDDASKPVGEGDPSQLFEQFGIRPAIDTLELLNSTDVDEYLIENALVKGQPSVAAGQSKTMKTTLCIDAAVSLATGTSFLGVHQVPEPKRVLFLTAEIGRATCRETVRRIANARGVEHQLRSDGGMIHWGTWVPYIPDDEQLRIVEHEFKRVRPDVVVFDPLYQMMDGDTQANYALNGQQLRKLSRLCEDNNVTPNFVDHCKKLSKNAENRDPLELEDISGAGKAEFFRQWWLISRRQAYDPDQPHELWVTVGGSAGHSAIWALTIDESRDFDNRRGYLLTARPRSELIQEKKAARLDRVVQKDAEHTERIAKKAKELIDRVFHGDRTLCLSKANIREHMRLNADYAGQTIAYLIESKEIRLIPKGVLQNGRKYDGYALFDALPFDSDNSDNSDMSEP